MARLQRRAHRVLWINPRAGAPGFAPRMTTMAAALPLVDHAVPAGTGLASLARVLEGVEALSSTASRGSPAGPGPR